MKKILSILLVGIMLISMMPMTSHAATDCTVTDNVIDIEDKEVYYKKGLGSAKVTNIKITGAEVASAAEDGTTVDILLAGGTEPDAEISIEFEAALDKKMNISGHQATVTLANGAASVDMTLKGQYSSFSNFSGTATYTLNFSLAEVSATPPERLSATESLSAYSGVSVTLNLKDYFKNATEYYLVDGGEKTRIDGKTYTFKSFEGGIHTIVFSASNANGECPDLVTITIEVTEIESGAWLGITTSNGSVNFVKFTDADGNEIAGLTATLEDKNITVCLPRTFDANGKIIATFDLTQNNGLPKLSTSNAFNGSNDTKVYTTTLSGGMGQRTFYLYNAHPKAISNNYTTYTITYAVENKLPALSGIVSAEAAVEANEIYTLDLSPVFTDADGDALTYFVSINGAAAMEAEANYSFSTDVAGTYTLVFSANDGKGNSVEVYTVTLTVENSTETNVMTVSLPEDLTPVFYATTGFSDGIDQLGVCLEAVKGETIDGMTAYEVKYPINAEMISVRTDNFGGMAFDSAEGGAVTLRKAQFSVVDYNNQTASSSNKVTYGEHTAAAGTDGWLLVSGTEYSFSVTSNDSALAGASQSITLEASSEVYTAEFTLGISNPVSITVPTGAKAQLYKYNQYYSNTEHDAKIIKDNEDGTTTYQFVADLNAHGASFIYRVTMEGKITKAGWLDWNEYNLTVTYTDDDKSPSYRRNDYSATGEESSAVAEDSVLLNINSRNHLNLSVGESKTLKAYRAWEIIPVSYNNYIIPPDFHYEILSGEDVVSLTKKASASACDGDWMTLTAVKDGIAIVEVTYDAIDVRDTGSTVHYSGIFGASDPARSGLLVVQVGENNDSSVNFGIDSFTSIGTVGASNITYNPNKQKEWDVEFDTLYFLGNSGKLTLKPTASSAISEVSVSHDKGATWKTLSGENGVYTAEIVPGNNILRVSTESGTAYQVVRGDKISVKFDELSENSNDNGIIEAGETVRVYLNGLHNPIPKMAGNYNPGYGGNTDGYSSQHLNYTCNGTPIYGIGAQYNFITTVNYVDIVMPADGSNVTLTDGYIGLGVLGLSAFFDGGDSHRNIPDNGCGTRANQSTFHTRSILPEITVSVGDTSAPNAAPIVRANAVSEAAIYSDQKFAINPDTLFTDPDNDAMTFMVSVNGAEPTEAPLDYKFTPSGIGTYTLHFTATDGKAFAEHTITLTVKKRPASDTPSSSDSKDKFGLSSSEIAGYVTISFTDQGKRVSGETGLKYPKALGTIISATKVPYKKGEKITHVTKRLLDYLGIEMAYSGTLESGFYLGAICNFVVKGTPYDSMGEFDAGVGSGWMITLNKTFIEYGASEFTVKNGDVIKWQYTCQLGKDIGDPFYSSSTSSNKNNKKEEEKKEEAKSEVSATLESVGNYLYETVKKPVVDSIGGEWAVLGLARSEMEIPDVYFENYYRTVIKHVKECDGVLHDKKYTEYSRVILALTAIGKNPEDVAGYNLLKPLGDYEKTVWQGVNGAIWALIALDSGNYTIPNNPEATVQATRELYINHILEKQTSDGGWALSGDRADPDVTGMALQALSKYRDNAKVKAAIEKALNCLSKMQKKNGGFSTYESETSESSVQVLVALCELGISTVDARFVKSGKSVLDNLLSYYDGKGFKHIYEDAANLMATEQGFYALVALKRASEGKNTLYDMRDAKKLTANADPEGLPGKNADVHKMNITRPGKTFADIVGHKDKEAIEALAARGIINGKTENSFAPDGTMTRAEFATIIANGLGLPQKTDVVFNDVTTNDWFYTYVGTAYAYGIIKGVSENEFNPNGAISREEAAVMLARAANLCGMDTNMNTQGTRDVLAQFADYVTASAWAQTALAFCYNEKILDDSVMDILPRESVTRAEIACMLLNMLSCAELL